MTDTNEAIAAFLAKGGKINRVDADATSGISDRDFYYAARGKVTNSNERFIPMNENTLIGQRIIHCTDHLGRSIITNGLGELIVIG